ncbi:MAG: hypothetical protein HN759_02690 [Akkermansiaceae bacterium]|nr:hypothetical protein [Akkermansiaceae bacterium]
MLSFTVGAGAGAVDVPPACNWTVGAKEGGLAGAEPAVFNGIVGAGAGGSGFEGALGGLGALGMLSLSSLISSFGLVGASIKINALRRYKHCSKGHVKPTANFFTLIIARLSKAKHLTSSQEPLAQDQHGNITSPTEHTFEQP